MSTTTTSNNNNNNNNGDETLETKVIIKQKLLKVNECFIYRIPPMQTSGGHRADDWDLAKPIETCTLSVEREDNILNVNFFAQRPKIDGPKGSTEEKLFAKCIIDMDIKKNNNNNNKNNKNLPMEHWIEGVVDSSRYFACRIKDPKSGREAHIGMGFRERDDASNFKMALQDYENSLRREQTAEIIHKAYEEKEGGGGGGGSGESGTTTSSTSTDDSSNTNLPLPVSKLSLKEGEKLHINIKGTSSSSSTSQSSHRKKKESKGTSSSGGGGPFLLKKPPPPAASEGATTTTTTVSSQLVPEQKQGNNEENNDDDDEDWGDFES